MTRQMSHLIGSTIPFSSLTDGSVTTLGSYDSPVTTDREHDVRDAETG